MADETTLPDTEGALRQFLRDDVTVAAAVGTRVFLGVDNPSAFPIVSLQRIGGGLVATAEGFQDLALIQLDVWGDVNAKASCWSATSAVIQALHRMDEVTGGTLVTDRARLHGAVVQSYFFSPDESSRSRYIITAQVMATPAD